LCVGDWIRVRGREEILATLDENGCLDGMPFMPEMLAWCGQTLQVSARAHKTCDTIEYGGARRIDRTVHLLDSRCDGSAHGGCQAACSLYWNEAWIQRVSAPDSPVEVAQVDRSAQPASACTMGQLLAATQHGQDAEKGPKYACQATELLKATRKMSRYDLAQYIEDYRSGNVGLATMMKGTTYRVGIYIVRRAERWGRRIGMGDALARAVMASYDAVQRLIPGGIPFPRRKGEIPPGKPTPNLDIGTLGPGCRVRVKSYQEILQTLNTDNKNRGLYFDAEHVPYCGREFSVRGLVTQIIDERDGYMLRFKSPSIILDSVVCKGTYSDHRMFCPRAIYPYWRPIWLKPVESERQDRPE
jgi:hypothetical protein